MNSSRSGEHSPRWCHTQIVGFGPAAMSLAVAADRHELLEGFLRRGMVFIERRRLSQWQSLSYDIRANTFAGGFLAGVRDDGAFAPILNSAAALELRRAAKQRIALPYASSFLKQASFHLAEQLDAYPRSALIQNTTVAALSVAHDGVLTSLDGMGRSLARSAHAVIATGAEECLWDSLRITAGVGHDRWVLSESVLKRACDAKIAAALGSGRSVIVIGGSHSALSVTEYLLRRFGERISRAQVKLVRRRPVRLYSDARRVYVAIRSLRETRVEMLAWDGTDLPASCLDAALYIQATGYRARPLALYDELGTRLELRTCQGNLCVDDRCRVLLADRTPLENVFALGLGHAMNRPTPSGKPEFLAAVHHFYEAASIIAQHIAARPAIDSRRILDNANDQNGRSASHREA